MSSAARKRWTGAFAAFCLAAAPSVADGSLSAPTPGTAGFVGGQVRTGELPLADSQVYAYQLADLTLRKVATDPDGRFTFAALPAGLYKIVAFKKGFVPGVALLTRASAQAVQFLEVELESDADVDSAADFWTVRKQIPTDVLRDIDLMLAAADATPALAPRVDRLSARMRAVTGVDSLAADGAHVSGGHLQVASALDDLTLGVQGHFVTLEGRNGLTTEADGRSQAVSVDVAGSGSTRIRVSSIDNRLRTPASDDARMGLQSHRLSWSRDLGPGESRFAAQYVEEDNFYAGAGVTDLIGLPGGSRMWNLEGNYTMSVGQRSRVEAGFVYRDRDIELIDSEWGSMLPSERVELFGRGGTTVHPSVLVEYGVYSTMRDGTVSLMPQGGVVLKLGDDWRAATSASLKMHDDPIEARRLNDFHTGYFRDYASCERAAAECYQLVLSRFAEDQEKLSIGAIHRRFDESLRLHFDENFFNYHENLQLVRGDAVPELQFALNQRLSPNVHARFESNLGAGGGGVLVLSDEQPYENQVRYLVTSVDTQFEQTATGVFVAFHHLQQRLEPVESRPLEELLELERLQLMLTQDLGVLSEIASNWAVQLNMELSRGSLPAGDGDLGDDGDLRSRITGGLAVSF